MSKKSDLPPNEGNPAREVLDILQKSHEISDKLFGQLQKSHEISDKLFGQGSDPVEKALFESASSYGVPDLEKHIQEYEERKMDMLAAKIAQAQQQPTATKSSEAGALHQKPKSLHGNKVNSLKKRIKIKSALRDIILDVAMDEWRGSASGLVGYLNDHAHRWWKDGAVPLKDATELRQLITTDPELELLIHARANDDAQLTGWVKKTLSRTVD